MKNSRSICFFIICTGFFLLINSIFFKANVTHAVSGLLTQTADVSPMGHTEPQYQWGDLPVKRTNLSGIITDENGQPIPGASVKIVEVSFRLPYKVLGAATTDEKGSYSIEFDYEIVNPKHVLLSINGYNITKQFRHGTLNFQMPSSRSEITGTVTLPNGLPASEAPVSLVKRLCSQNRCRVDLASTTADKNGAYTLSVIPGDLLGGLSDYILTASINNPYGKSIEPVQLGKTHKHNFVAANVIFGTIKGESGYSVEGANVELVGIGKTKTDHNGSFAFYDTDYGDYELRISGEGVQPLNKRNVRPNEEISIEIPDINFPPVVTAVADRLPDSNEWYNRNVTVTFSAEDSRDYWPIEKIDSPVTVSTEGAGQVITGTATDTAGLKGEGSVTINLDKTAPKTEALLSDTGWTNKDATVELNASDNLSGIEKTEYSYDGTAWSPYSQPITVSAEGKTEIYYRSTDKAGNQEDTQRISVKIDKTAPELKISLDKSELWSPNHKMVNVNAVVEGGDDLSGIAKSELVSIENSEKDEGNSEKDRPQDVQGASYGTLDVSFDLRAERFTKEGRIYSVTYKAMDNAGNETSETATVTVPHARKK